MTPDPDLERFLAVSLHDAECLIAFGPRPFDVCSQRHRTGHVRRAKQLLRLWDNAGYALTTKES